MGMTVSESSSDSDEIVDVNVVPLIDVMLVLLIMFIITIPVATHAVNIDLPQPSPPTDQIVDPIKNKLVLTRNGEILWNANAVNQGQLVSLLQDTTKMAVEPELQFEPEPDASYQLSAAVLNIIKASGVTKFGFVGNEKYRTFDK